MLAGAPAGFVVSLLAVCIERPRRLAIAGLTISTLTGLLFIGFIALLVCSGLD